MGNYSIRWEFETSDVSNMKKVIRAIGSKSLYVIQFRDRNGKLVDIYDSWVMFPREIADDKTIQYIDKTLKKNKNIYYMVIRR